MAKASGGPSSEQLLELLKRAAEELKAARDESARFQRELVGERKIREDAEAALTQERTVGGQHPKMREALDEVQGMYQSLKVNFEQLQNELQLSRENLINEVAAQRQIKAALERESAAHSQTRAALEAEQNALSEARAGQEAGSSDQSAALEAEQTAHLGTRAALEAEQAAHVETRAALEAEQTAHGEARAALEAEQAAHVQTRETAEEEKRAVEDGFITQRDESRTALQNAEDALEEVRAQLAGELQRVADLNEALAAAGGDRDTAQARVDTLEAARESDRQLEETRLKALEDKAALELAREQQAVVDAQAALQQEKEKHQSTAQKFLGEKQNARQLDTQLQEAKTRVAELESATQAAAEEHARELVERDGTWKQAEAQWAENLANVEAGHAEQLKQRDAADAAREQQHQLELQQLMAQLAPLQQAVQTTQEERVYVERKYEELARELQLTLDQRDEARRMLETAQAERQRLERALTQLR